MIYYFFIIFLYNTPALTQKDNINVKSACFADQFEFNPHWVFSYSGFVLD